MKQRDTSRASKWQKKFRRPQVQEQKRHNSKIVWGGKRPEKKGKTYD